MAKHILKSTHVTNAKGAHEGGKKYHKDGGGLFLQVSKYGSKSWVFRRRQPDGKIPEVGLGSYPEVGLAKARELAGEVFTLTSAGVPAKMARDIVKAEQSAEVHEEANLPAPGVMTFDKCAEEYIKTKVEPESRNVKHVQQWRNTLKTYASPVMGSLPVDEVDDHHILAILEPIWHTKTESAQRVMQRIAKILNWAKVRKLRTGDNPALWAGHLEALLPSPGKIKKVTHFNSLPYPESPEFMQELKLHPGHAARCLEFTVLTACRSGETRAARWEEVDLDAKLWIIPPERMKAGREHRVPLSKPAIKILKGQQDAHDEFVFPGERGASCLSNMAMENVLRRMDRKPITTHGFRSTFRNWAAEQTNFPREVCEQALAHTLRSAVEAAYLHTDLLEKRAKLMNDWARYLCKIL